MPGGYLRTARYALSWKSGALVETHETAIRRNGDTIPATLVLPESRRKRVPGWVAIGGVSLMGRFHPQLVRFAESLAASGAAVLVPEIPEWRRLEVTPSIVRPTLEGCIEVLRERPEVLPDRFGVIGFSFGAPGLAIAASDERVADDIAGIVLFGGYYCLERTMGCMLTGQHEWEGVEYSLDPDPYGRWVVAGNHLTGVPGLEDASDVAAALRTLAASASGQRIPAWQPYHDRMIVELRSGLPASRRPVFDCFATASTAARPELDRCKDMARRLAAACRRIDPLLEPAKRLGRVDVPTQVIHGQRDRLVPFTEAHRLMGGLQEHARRGATVTGLFHHSAEHTPPALLDRTKEQLKLLGALRRMINTTEGAC
jgi:pimeloyl-ACP methyl ester carboxylesterase